MEKLDLLKLFLVIRPFLRRFDTFDRLTKQVASGRIGGLIAREG